MLVQNGIKVSAVQDDADFKVFVVITDVRDSVNTLTVSNGQEKACEMQWEMTVKLEVTSGDGHSVIGPLLIKESVPAVVSNSMTEENTLASRARDRLVERLSEQIVLRISEI
jgi:hypothetical protein